MNAKSRIQLALLSSIAILLLVSACAHNTTGDPLAEAPLPATPEASSAEVAVTTNPSSLFLEDALVSSITEEFCTLSGGTETTCYRITVTSIPTDHEPGPWCPGTITDTAEAGGIWPEGGEIYDVDGPFVENLDTFYNDGEWKLYNDDGTIRVTGTAEQCAAAARPDVDEAYQNYCVQCLPSHVDEGVSVHTYVIPIIPVAQTTPSAISMTGIGVALNGVTFDPPAPTNAILSAHTLAPFDDCGGHINLNEGYHYHAHTGCSTEAEQPDSHAPMIGYALDGFPIYALLDKNGEAPSGLDQCRGESDEIRGYHYHVAAPGSNSFIDCFSGEIGCKFEGDGAGQICDATATGDRPNGPDNGGRPGGSADPPPGFSEAAAQLGVTVEELMAALGEPPFDLEAAAATLGVTVEELTEALPSPPQQQPGPPPQG
ncbi:MAG: YHYH protein [Cyanobacteria bacterium J06639_14]